MNEVWGVARSLPSDVVVSSSTTMLATTHYTTKL